LTESGIAKQELLNELLVETEWLAIFAPSQRTAKGNR